MDIYFSVAEWCLDKLAVMYIDWVCVVCLSTGRHIIQLLSICTIQFFSHAKKAKEIRHEILLGIVRLDQDAAKQRRTNHPSQLAAVYSGPT